jgi:hypothetical protein
VTAQGVLSSRTGAVWGDGPLPRNGFRTSPLHVIHGSAMLLEETSTVRSGWRNLRGHALVLVVRVIGVTIAGVPIGVGALGVMAIPIRR